MLHGAMPNQHEMRQKLDIVDVIAEGAAQVRQEIAELPRPDSKAREDARCTSQTATSCCRKRTSPTAWKKRTCRGGAAVEAEAGG